MASGTRVVNYDDPAEVAALVRGMSGLEFFQAVMKGEAKRAPIADLVGFEFTAVEAGKVTLKLPIGGHLYNPIGSVHGGIAATILDTVMGCSVHSMLPVGRVYSTLEIKISYLRPITEALGAVFAEGWVVNLGRKAAFAEGKVVDGAGKIYATGSSTCAVWDV